MLAIAAASIVLALLGFWSFSAGIAFLLIGCALAASLAPRGFAFYAFAGLAPSFILALRDGARSGPFLPLLVACAAAALGGRLLADSRDRSASPDVAARLRRLALLIWGLTLFPLYPAAKLSWVRVQVRRFCDDVHPGDAVTGLEARARSLGLEVVNRPAPLDGSRKPALSAFQGFTFARTFCDVEYEAGRVTDARRTFVD
ncbi:MAG TPA: hypothetical protein VFQ35_14350 [Polyangiaceae bacterium]|nr:hypothetical protein [Polyangiaceae bacterium]